MIELKIFYRKMSPGFSLRIFTFYLLICFTSANKKTRDNSTGPYLYRSIKSVPSFEPTDREVDYKYFLQKLDHFEKDESIEQEWLQRYVMDDKFFDEVKGIFILSIGGEGPIRNSPTGAKLNWVKKFFAYYLCLEHRFYGKSQPKGDWSIENLKYLTVAQALEDTARFIGYIKETVDESKNKKWIVVGGSYSGALAAWMRRNYPELVDGAVASSASFPTKPFMPEFYEVIVETMNIGFRLNPSSFNNIKQAFEDLKKMMESDCHKVSNLFKVDIDCKDKNQVSLFFLILTRMFFVTFMGNKKIMEVLFAMRQRCNAMQCNEKTKKGKYTKNTNLFDVNLEQPVNSLAEVFGEMMPKNYRKTMLKEYENELKEEQSNEYYTDRQYTYQMCTEIGGFETPDSEKHPFGHHFDSEFMLKVHCQDIFGEEYNEGKIKKGIKKINKKFGGLNSKFSQTIFTVGKWDPYKPMQMTKENKFGNLVIEIEEASHCQDLLDKEWNDPDSLINARKEVVKLIEKILKGEEISGER